jgi:hypothetical protein
MKIDTICALLIEALREASYNESAVFNYQGVIRRFKVFCREKGVTEYTPAFGKTYAGLSILYYTNFIRTS